MAMRREPVTLDFSGYNFAAEMRRAEAAVGSLGAQLARAEATWEPHDWTEF